MKRVFQNVALILGSILFTLLVAEVLVRVVVPRERWEFRDATADWEPDSLLGWSQKRNYSTTNYDLSPAPIVFRTNIDGFRPYDLDPTSIDTSDFVIFLVGNSTVNGRAVAEEYSIHARLDSLFNVAGRRTIIVNASVQGYSTDQALIRLQRFAKGYKPDWIVYGFCENDLGGNMSDKAYGLSKPRFVLDRETLVLQPPAHANDDMRGFREPSWKDFYVKSALFRLVRPIILSFQASRSTDPATRILVGAHGADFYFDPQRLLLYDWDLQEVLIQQMDKLSRSLNSSFVFYAHPTPESVWKPQTVEAEAKVGGKIDPFVLERKLGEIAQNTNTAFIPMVEVFLESQNRGPFHLLPRDTHCNEAGYLVQAEIIASYILSHVQTSGHGKLPTNIQ